MYKMERVQGMLVGFGFLSLALFIKSIYAGPNSTIIGYLLITLIVAGPYLVSKILTPNKIKSDIN